MSVETLIYFPTRAAYRQVQRYAENNGVTVSQLAMEALEKYTDIPLVTPNQNARGGKARAAALTPERRKEIAQKAVNARWDKTKKN